MVSDDSISSPVYTIRIIRQCDEKKTWLRRPKRIVTNTTPRQCIHVYIQNEMMPRQESDGSWNKRQHTQHMHKLLQIKSASTISIYMTTNIHITTVQTKEDEVNNGKRQRKKKQFLLVSCIVSPLRAICDPQYRYISEN